MNFNNYIQYNNTLYFFWAQNVNKTANDHYIK